jgi:hypothetical protein
MRKKTVPAILLTLSIALTISCGEGAPKKTDAAPVKDSTATAPSTTSSETTSAVNASTALPIDSKLVPQAIDYDGKPDLEYNIGKSIIALDTYDDKDVNGKFVRMKIGGKEIKLKLDQKTATSDKRKYSNNDYSVTFFEVKYEDCLGEGYQNLNGKILIETKEAQNTVAFKGYDLLFASKKCQ